MSDIVAIQLLPTANLSLDVLRADMSKGAKLLYWLLASLPPTENNKIEVPQQILANELKSSVSSIGRYLKELVVAKFVKFLEEQIPGKVRSLQLTNRLEKKILEVEKTARPLTTPRALYTPPNNYVLPIDQPFEKDTTELDAMGNAVLEEALKEELPPGKEVPESIDKYCEQYLWVVQPKGFFTMAYIIRAEYKRRYKVKTAKIC